MTRKKKLPDYPDTGANGEPVYRATRKYKQEQQKAREADQAIKEYKKR